MQLKFRIVKEIMPIWLVETNYAFLLSVRLYPLLRRARSPPTPGRFALIYKRNDIDQNYFRGSFGIRCRASMSIFIIKC